jgi:hypothetical protein
MQIIDLDRLKTLRWVEDSTGHVTIFPADPAISLLIAAGRLRDEDER